jgi:hypothetical protein
MADVVFIYVAPAPSLLHHNNVGVTYAKISNFRMEPVKFVPLYFVAMIQLIIIVIEIPFVSTPIHNIVGIKSKGQIPNGT